MNAIGAAEVSGEAGTRGMNQQRLPSQSAGSRHKRCASCSSCSGERRCSGAEKMMRAAAAIVAPTFEAGANAT